MFDSLVTVELGPSEVRALGQSRLNEHVTVMLCWWDLIAAVFVFLAADVVRLRGVVEMMFAVDD